MSTPVNLAVFAGDQPWSVLQVLAHCHRPDHPLRRLCVYIAAGDPRPAADTARLVRVLKDLVPDLRVETREGGSEPGSVRAHLEVWHRGDPAAAWVLALAGVAAPTAWAAEAWIGRAGCRVLQPRPEGSWVELRRDADGRIETEPCPDFRREGTDSLPLAALVRAFAAADVRPGATADDWRAAESLPLVPLTEAAIRSGWNWAEAFGAGATPNGDSEDQLFQRYLAGFAATLGVAQAGRTGASGGHVWLSHGGRLLLLDARVAPEESPENPGEETATRHPLEELAALSRRWPGVPVEPLWIRPAHRLSATERALAVSLGIRVLDEADGPELPSRLARLLALPLSVEGTEIERLIRHHLAASGRLRVFGPESSILRGQAGTGADPVLAEVESWLEQVRVARRQNWLAWRQAGRLQVRVPASGASSPADDWRLLVSAVLRLGPDDVKAEAAAGTVTLGLADQPEVRRRLAAWFRPFLNSHLTFVAARDRLAAEARAAMEAPAPRDPAPRPAAPATAPARRPGPTPAPAPAPNRRPPAARPTKRVSLEDLDQALNDALGG